MCCAARCAGENDEERQQTTDAETTDKRYDHGVPFSTGCCGLLSVSLLSVVALTSRPSSMLCELRIANVAIIDQLQLSLAAGMNVLTGETGAGKSIIMRAIGLLCGDRGATELIRTDADEAEIEGLFALEPP